MTTSDITDLLSPIMRLAQVRHDNGLKNMVDRAAEHVVKIAQHTLGAHDYRTTTNKSFHTLLTSQSIDEICENFISQHPKGHIIEVNGAMSTRFHRLSEYSDWPRFTWTNINTPEVVKFRELFFPVTDNYNSASLKYPDFEWTSYLNDSPANSSLILLGENKPFDNTESILQQVKLLTHSKKHTKSFQAVICVTRSALKRANIAINNTERAWHYQIIQSTQKTKKLTEKFVSFFKPNPLILIHIQFNAPITTHMTTPE